MVAGRIGLSIIISEETGLANLNLSATLEVAIDVVRDASRIAKNEFHHPQEIHFKNGGEPVTQTDILVDQQIISTLSDSFPQHGFISEESDPRNDGAEYVWLLDPIDGTKQFSRGVPLYSISLALRRDSEIVLGIVYVVETGELFTAIAGQGAWLNREAISCSSQHNPADCVICVDLPGRLAADDVLSEAIANVREMMETCARFRVLGSSAMALGYCAGGGFDVYLNLGRNAKIWDIAAGQIIVQEAGGRFTTTKKGNLIAGNESIHDAMIDLLDL